jgi:hypothetical protein
MTVASSAPQSRGFSGDFLERGFDTVGLIRTVDAGLQAGIHRWY